MLDFLLYETGDGGDFFLQANDLALTSVLAQQVYIRLFGGNLEASTRGDEISSEVRHDWWGNSLIFQERISKQMNSQTERILDSIVLNSYGRIKVRNAVLEDLKGIEDVAKYSVEVVLSEKNKITIFVKISPLDNREEKTIQIVWDVIKNQLIQFIQI